MQRHMPERSHGGSDSTIWPSPSSVRCSWRGPGHILALMLSFVAGETAPIRCFKTATITDFIIRNRWQSARNLRSQAFGKLRPEGVPWAAGMWTSQTQV